MKDPIVEEVRSNRAKIAEECGFDLNRILEHAQAAARQIPGFTRITIDELKSRRARSAPTSADAARGPGPQTRKTA